LQDRFIGKVVIVTGAGQGIGRECAIRLANEGGHVVVADRVESTARNVVDQIRASGRRADLFVGDLSSASVARQLVAEVTSNLGRVDVSVHNVGGAMWTKRFWEFSDREIEQEIQRSLWPTLWCCRAVLPKMIEQGSGAVVNIGSTATRGINRVPYSTAKGGVHALTTCLALETATLGVRVNCVAPGGTHVAERPVPRNAAPLSDVDRAGLAGVIEQTMRDTPLGRLGTVAEQAAAVAFLASDEASYLTGQTVYVGGGAIG
jgi:dihydroxycyclohexadiene carboxylate dehydrogenase